MKRFLSLLGFLPALAAAQVETDAQGWLQLNGFKNIGNGWRIFGEIQPRFGQNFTTTSQLLLRTAIGRDVGNGYSLWLGYAWTPNIEPDFRSEDRYFIQGWSNVKSGKWRVQNRTRLELRQIDGANGESWRGRHLVRGAAPFTKDARFTGIIQNELFWNFNSAPNGPKAGFDQNRTLAGLGYQLSKATRIEAGYQPILFGSPVTRRFDTLLVALFHDF